MMAESARRGGRPGFNGARRACRQPRQHPVADELGEHHDRPQAPDLPLVAAERQRQHGGGDNRIDEEIGQLEIFDDRLRRAIEAGDEARAADERLVDRQQPRFEAAVGFDE